MCDMVKKSTMQTLSMNLHLRPPSTSGSLSRKHKCLKNLSLEEWCRTLFIYQLTHTTLRSVEILKHSKIDKNAPTCFGLHGDHLQGAKVSTWLNIQVRLTVDTCKMCRGSSVLWLHIVTRNGVCVVHSIL